MRKYVTWCVMLFCMPMVAYATWQVADPAHGMPAQHMRADQVGVQRDIPEHLSDGKQVDVQLSKGTLRSNIERAALQNDWYVLWRTSERDQVLVNTHIVGPSFPAVMSKLLGHYSQLRARYNLPLRTMEVFSK